MAAAKNVVVPAGDKDSADGTGNADDTGDNSSEEDFVPADDNGSADDTGNTGNKF
jgi:hypothetical protein